MLDSSIVMFLLKDRNDKSFHICELGVNQAAQDEILGIFKFGVNNFVGDKKGIVFDGNYKPNEDQYLFIPNFPLHEKIKRAIEHPRTVANFGVKDLGRMEIIAIFVGECVKQGGIDYFTVAFQRFRKEQYMKVNGIDLYLERDSDTFLQAKGWRITISNCVDCLYVDNQLRFSSFHFARQIFDLSDFYRTATQKEVESFCKNSRLHVENVSEFLSVTNPWMRRKIALINDSEVLINKSANEIKSIGKDIGININVEDEKIVIPNDKDEIEIILGFLDEEVYKGWFSQTAFFANSKRKVERN